MGKRGFTLIELLIVIAILGILVALILPRFSDVREDANTKVCVANLRGLASAMATYEVKENTDGDWATNADPDVLVSWGYIAAEPYCPYSSSSQTSYTLIVASGSNPDKADCPNGPLPNGDGSYADHVWP